MGLLDSALAGFTGGYAKSGADNIQKDIDAKAKAEADETNRVREDELATNRAEMIEGMKLHFADQQRVKQIGEVSNKAEELAGTQREQLLSSYEDVDEKGRPLPLSQQTPTKLEDMSAEDQATFKDAGKSPMELARAEAALGYASNAKLADMDNKNEMSQLRGEVRLSIAEQNNKRAMEVAQVIAMSRGMNGGLTKSQQLHDFETDKAREMLTGLTPEEIKHRTSKFSNTGRDNPDYDPSIATRLRLAGRRKYGDDPYFDNLRPEHAQSESYSAPVVNPIERFSSDPAMKNYKPGKQTASGLEVLDSSGKLVGHYK